MRVGYICADPGVPVFGSKGCSIHVQEMVRAFAGQGCDVEMFAARSGVAPRADLARVPVHSLSAASHGDLAAREEAALGANDELSAALAAVGDLDLLYERYALWSFAGMEFARRRRIPGLLEVNAPLIEEQIAYRGLADRVVAERLARRVFLAASALLAVSHDVAGYLERRGVSSDRIHVIPNAVDPDRFPPDASPSRPAPDLFTVGFVGSLKPWHDLTALVDAFSRAAAHDGGWRLLIVGDGPERGTLERELSSRGLSRHAELTGAVSPGQVAGLLASMDVAVAPYAADAPCYFSPLKVFEYMAAGRPVVASRSGQLRELIRDGVTGMLYPPGDSAALAEAIWRLRGDADLRSRLGACARAEVARDHTWAARARQVLMIAKQCSVGRATRGTSPARRRRGAAGPEAAGA